MKVKQQARDVRLYNNHEGVLAGLNQLNFAIEWISYK